VVSADLTKLERELLEAVQSRFGQATDGVDEQLPADSPGRAVVESALRSLRERGLVTSEWSYGTIDLRPRDGTEAVHREYEGDWRELTDAGRAAIGLPPKTEAVAERFWMNPSSGPWRVSPLIAPLCA